MTRFEDVVVGRRSVRKFSAEIPSEALLGEAIRLAMFAPSPMNRQDWHFSIVLSADARTQILRVVEQRWDDLCAKAGGNEENLRSHAGHFAAFRDAPVLVAVDIRRTAAFLEDLVGESAARLQGDCLSAGMAVQNLMLAAHARGLGSCVFTGCLAAEQDILSILGVGRNRRLACLVAIGFPAETPAAPPRRAPGELTSVIR